MLRVKAELKRLKPIFETLSCLETGTIRTYHEKHESTRHISNVIGENGHLKSIDIEPKSIAISKDICKNASNVEWILSSSLDYLQNDDDMYHFVLLDSVNNADYIFDEFKNVVKRIHVGGTIMIDDAGVDMNKNEDRTKKQKGVKVNQFLKDNNIDYSVVRGGHCTQLLIPITKKAKQKLEEVL
jgi:predicted O-methyltransferase YrrM